VRTLGSRIAQGNEGHHKGIGGNPNIFCPDIHRIPSRLIGLEYDGRGTHIDEIFSWKTLGVLQRTGTGKKPDQKRIGGIALGRDVHRQLGQQCPVVAFRGYDHNPVEEPTGGGRVSGDGPLGISLQRIRCFAIPHRLPPTGAPPHANFGKMHRLLLQQDL